MEVACIGCAEIHTYSAAIFVSTSHWRCWDLQCVCVVVLYNVHIPHSNVEKKPVVRPGYLYNSRPKVEQE